jgi:hypothetical protein
MPGRGVGSGGAAEALSDSSSDNEDENGGLPDLANAGTGLPAEGGRSAAAQQCSSQAAAPAAAAERRAPPGRRVTGRFAVPLTRDADDGELEDDVPDQIILAQYEESRGKKRKQGKRGNTTENNYASIDTKWWSHFVNGGTNWSTERKAAARKWVAADGTIIGDGSLRQFFRFLYLSSVSKHVFKVRASLSRSRAKAHCSPPSGPRARMCADGRTTFCPPPSLPAWPRWAYGTAM